MAVLIRESTDAPSPPPWVESILAHCESTYLGTHDVLVTTLDRDGAITDGEPLVADFGDILPFVWRFGLHGFVYDQIRCAAPFLTQGLYRRDGRVTLFYNHDWLLGLLELHRQSKDAKFLALAEEGARTLGVQYFRRDLLIDEKPSGRHWRTCLQHASPFNGGYIEIWVELFRLTGESLYLDWAKRLAGGWESDRGPFRRMESSRGFIRRVLQRCLKCCNVLRL